MAKNDEFVMERMRAGDSAAFRVVFDHNYAVLFRFALSLLHDRALAEEIADDAMLYLWQNCARIKISRSIRSYLMQAVKTRCVDSLRASCRVRKVSADSITPDDSRRFLERVFADESQPMGMLLSRELEDVLNRSIERLPKECGEVFRRSRYERERYEQIASDMGISVNTVKYHVKNALALLRKDLANYLKWIAIMFLMKS